MAPTNGQSIKQVRIGGPKVGGYAYRGEVGTTRPTTVSGGLDPAYVDLGYISDDGLSIKTDAGTDKIKDWNQDTIAVIQKQNEATLEVTFAQVSAAAAKAIFGDDNVETLSGDAGAPKSISYTGEVLPHSQWAFLMKDGNGESVLDIGDGQVTGIDGIEFKKDAIVSFKVTIELFKDSKGKFFNWLLADE